MATSRQAPATRGIGDARRVMDPGRVLTRDRRRDPSPGAASRQWPAGVFETCRWTCRRSFSTLRPLDGPDGRPVAEWDHKGRRLVPRAGARGRPRPPRDGAPPDAQAGAQQQFPGTDLQRRREAHCRRGRRRTAGRGRGNVAGGRAPGRASRRDHQSARHARCGGADPLPRAVAGGSELPDCQARSAGAADLARDPRPDPGKEREFDRRGRVPTRNDWFFTNLLSNIGYFAPHQPHAPCIPTRMTLDSPLG